MHLRLSVFLALFITHAALAENATELDGRARELAQSLLIVDTHIDVPYRLQAHWEDVTMATDGGDLDYPRSIAGGLNAPFMSIYVPASKEDEGGGWQLANLLIDGVEALVARAPEKYALAHSTSAVMENFAAGRISLPMGMENGTPIEAKLENILHFHRRGIRYITLAHSKSNHISDSSYDENRHWKGLSPFGLKVIAEMNRIGIMIDISHLSDDAARQAMDASVVPVIASHSSVRHFTPGWERNMSDELIHQLAASGGVIQINYGSTFLTKTANEWFNTFSAARTAFMEEHQHERESEEVDAFTKTYRVDNPFPYASLSDVLDHIDYVIKLAGVEHVGIGSDYDGVGDSLPVGLKSVDSYPNLIRGLLERGHSESDIKKIMGGNLMRVWKQTETHAAKN